MHPTTHGRHVRAVLTDCSTLSHSHSSLERAHNTRFCPSPRLSTTVAASHSRTALNNQQLSCVADTARGKSTHGRPHARTSPSLLHARHRTDCCTADLLHSNPAPFIHTSNWLHCISQTLPDPRQRHAALQLLNFDWEPCCLAAVLNSTPSTRFAALQLHSPNHFTSRCLAAAFNLFLAISQRCIAASLLPLANPARATGLNVITLTTIQFLHK
jgi:hypothetical protein